MYQPPLATQQDAVSVPQQDRLSQALKKVHRC